MGDFAQRRPIRRLFPHQSRWPPRGILLLVRSGGSSCDPPRSPARSRAGLCPPSSSVWIEIRKFGFKTFNSRPLFLQKGTQRNVPPPLSSSAPTGADLRHQGWRSLTRPQVEEVGWPPGVGGSRSVGIKQFRFGWRDRVPLNWDVRRRASSARVTLAPSVISILNRLRQFSILLTAGGISYGIDCLFGLALKTRPDLPWFEQGVYTGPLFLLTIGLIVGALLSLLPRKAT